MLYFAKATRGIPRERIRELIDGTGGPASADEAAAVERALHALPGSIFYPFGGGR